MQKKYPTFQKQSVNLQPLLAAASNRMKKSLGQHFLTNRSTMEKIISALDLKPDELLIEIGPGKGMLTFPFLEACGRLIVIEKDEILAEKLKENKKIEVIAGDALKIIPTLTSKIKNYKLAGNIPYYITGKLLRILSELKNKPSQAVIMIQQEVGERIISRPPKMNLLAAAVQFWAKPEILQTLKPKDFNPPPKVNSAIIKILPIAENKKIRKKYYRMIRIIFKQPRKTLFNNLKAGLKISKNKITGALRALKIEPNSRPQDLSIEQIQKLTSLL